MEDEIFNLILLAFAASMSEDAWEAIKEKDRAEKERRDSCQHVQLVADMGKTVPFCNYTNEPCDLHCMESTL